MYLPVIASLLSKAARVAFLAIAAVASLYTFEMRSTFGSGFEKTTFKIRPEIHDRQTGNSSTVSSLLKLQINDGRFQHLARALNQAPEELDSVFTSTEIDRLLNNQNLDNVASDYISKNLSRFTLSQLERLKGRYAEIVMPRIYDLKALAALGAPEINFSISKSILTERTDPIEDVETPVSDIDVRKAIDALTPDQLELYVEDFGEYLTNLQLTEIKNNQLWRAWNTYNSAVKGNYTKLGVSVFATYLTSVLVANGLSTEALIFTAAIGFVPTFVAGVAISAADHENYHSKWAENKIDRMAKLFESQYFKYVIKRFRKQNYHIVDALLKERASDKID